MDGDEPVRPYEHGLLLPLHTSPAVVRLGAEDPISLGQHVKVLFPPDVRPVVGLGFAGQVAVESDMGKLCIPEQDNPLGRPDIRPHMHSHPEDGYPVANGVAEFPLDEFAHHPAVKVQVVRV